MVNVQHPHGVSINNATGWVLC